MANRDGFWKGVVQNALGSFLAGLMLLAVGKVWVENHFDRFLEALKGKAGQVAALQTQVDRLEQALNKQILRDGSGETSGTGR